MKRILLVFAVGAIVAVIMATSAISLSAAQQAAGPSPSSGGPVCADRWFRDWYVSEDWLYFWWYQFCQNPDGEWFRAYHSWQWWEPVNGK